jgi:hypothetical protein
MTVGRLMRMTVGRLMSLLKGDKRTGRGIRASGDRRPSAFLLSYDDLSRLVIFVVLALVCLTFRDYGITNDEEVQKIYGEMILAFYSSGFHDLSALSYKDLFYYGGLFDVVAALVNKVSPLGQYETRHLLGGLVGVLGLVGGWRLARLLAGPRAGLAAVVLLALTPAYYGPAFNNPKDIPFAVGMLWTLYAMCRLVPDFPKPPLRRVLAFAVALGLTLGVRVGGGLAGIYLLLVIFVYLAWRAVEARTWRAAWDDGRQLTRALWPGLPVAYVTMAAFWPWAWQAPLNPLVAVAHFSHYGINIDTLLAGQWLPARHLPADYLPLYLLVTLPEIVLVGLAAALALVAAAALRRLGGRSAAVDRVQVLQLALVFLAAAFPLAFFLIERPTVYNGIRHFAFLLPPLVVIASLAMDRLLSLVSRLGEWPGQAVTVGLVAAALLQLWVMVRLHPDEYVYYNALAGGVSGANGRFELDYWGNSLAEAARDLTQYVEMENGGGAPPRTYKVAVCGDPLAATYYMPPYLQFTTKPSEADFFVAFTQHGCDRVVGGRSIIAVRRFGVALSVVKDRRPLPPVQVHTVAARPMH